LWIWINGCNEKKKQNFSNVLRFIFRLFFLRSFFLCFSFLVLCFTARCILGPSPAAVEESQPMSTLHQKLPTKTKEKKNKTNKTKQKQKTYLQSLSRQCTAFHILDRLDLACLGLALMIVLMK
jgi:hypothetical protein